jgi:hypothetical protein
VERARGDVEVGRSVAAGDRLHRRLAERAAREHARELEAVLAGIRSEAVDVDEPGDLTGVGRDVRDHRPAVRVSDEHDRTVDRADEVADRFCVGGEATQRIGGGDHVLPGAVQRVHHAIPARRLGERAVDENDRGRHEEGPFGW